MRFWDSSAVLPLLVQEQASQAASELLEDDTIMAVWWATSTECVSALSRLERDGSITESELDRAIDHLEALARSWHEVPANERMKGLARRLLRTHPLRAADALQLAAAMIVSEDEPRTLELVTLDARLGAAARKEGFKLPL